MIDWESSKRLKFSLTNNMYKQESILEKETHEILWDFGIQTGHLIPAKRPYLELLKKRKKKELVSLWILLFRWTTE